MLRSLKALKGYHLGAVDGELGWVDDTLFDDETWYVRYLVAKTGSWLFGRKVLILRHALGEVDWATRTIRIMLTQAQLKGAPDLATDAPVSRQQEHELLTHFGYTPYWAFSQRHAHSRF